MEWSSVQPRALVPNQRSMTTAVASEWGGHLGIGSGGRRIIEENGGGPPAAAEVTLQLARPLGSTRQLVLRTFSQLPPDPNVAQASSHEPAAGPSCLEQLMRLDRDERRSLSRRKRALRVGFSP